MTWASFVLIFSLGTLVLMWLTRRLFQHHALNVCQVVLFVASLTFLIDYPAETRKFWFFYRTSTWKLLDTPIENHVFVAACAVIILIVYQSLRAYRGVGNRG